MKRFNINGGPVLLFEDKLWVPVEAEQTIHSTTATEAMADVEHLHIARPEGMTTLKTALIKRRGRKPRFDQSSEQTEQIKADLRAGNKPGVLALRYPDVPVQTIYNIKMRMKKEGEVIKQTVDDKQDPTDPDMKTYQCIRNHRFTSTAKQSEAVCHCGTKAFREIKN